jgi:hypothetical protein
MPVRPEKGAFGRVLLRMFPPFLVLLTCEITINILRWKSARVSIAARTVLNYLGYSA